MQLLKCIFSYMSTIGCKWRECITYASLFIYGAHPSSPEGAVICVWPEGDIWGMCPQD